MELLLKKILGKRMEKYPLKAYSVVFIREMNEVALYQVLITGRVEEGWLGRPFNLLWMNVKRKVYFWEKEDVISGYVCFDLLTARRRILLNLEELQEKIEKNIEEKTKLQLELAERQLQVCKELKFDLRDRNKLAVLSIPSVEEFYRVKL